MSDQGELYGDSWILYHVLDRMMGNQEMVAIRRKLLLLDEQIDTVGYKDVDLILTGSLSEGVSMFSSDIDCMEIINNVVVICPDQDTSTTSDSIGKSVFIMRDAHSRPGYVNLELVKRGHMVYRSIKESIVRVEDLLFISSDMFKQLCREMQSSYFQIPIETHGPAGAILSEQSKMDTDMDVVFGFRCNVWPREADEWVSRPRLHDWPGKGLIHQIVQGGCYLVPVGDKTSSDTFLQWRISFASAERKLIHSVSHVQFLVYCLLKYILKQISDKLKQIYRDEDIVSSYIIKTVLFYALECTSKSFWQERNIFLCFMLCLNILTSWVKTAYCPNYFISNNNMFLGKVHGEVQQSLLHFLVYLHNKTWGCLSIGTFFKPQIGERITLVKHGHWEVVLTTPARLERECDLYIMMETMGVRISETSAGLMTLLCRLFYKSDSDMDDYITYYHMSNALAVKGMETFEGRISCIGNKDKYKRLRKSKVYMAPLASVCSSPGLLTLATYHYQTGNYIKTLEMCGHVISSWRVFVGVDLYKEDGDRYEHLYCGRGYNLLYKCQQAFESIIAFPKKVPQMCPSQLHHELQHCKDTCILIPPLPYAMFLSFLCYHELGDTRRRDTALTQLQTVKHYKNQGVSKWWIVHNLLGICYELIGDKARALREYRDSLGGDQLIQYNNPAREKIERLEHSN
ncbi:uncharacterized protein [Argopecten irradians]|uniref:uncharacterized protein n=1 Tax=Argopecten irradians TaxID=31199 RepID=UPI00371EF95B